MNKKFNLDLLLREFIEVNDLEYRMTTVYIPKNNIPMLIKRMGRKVNPTTDMLKFYNRVQTKFETRTEFMIRTGITPNTKWELAKAMSIPKKVLLGPVVR